MNNSIEQKFDRILREQIWPALDVQVICSYRDRLSQRKNGDYRIACEGIAVDIDIKAEQDVPPNLPIELHQDWPSNDLGWFYTLTACDELWYGQYRNDDLTVYRVSFRRLRKLPPEITKTWSVKRCVSGQGDTLFIAAPLSVLMERNVARIVWPIDRQAAEEFSFEALDAIWEGVKPA